MGTDGDKAVKILDWEMQRVVLDSEIDSVWLKVVASSAVTITSLDFRHNFRTTGLRTKGDPRTGMRCECRLFQGQGGVGRSMTSICPYIQAEISSRRSR